LDKLKQGEFEEESVDRLLNKQNDIDIIADKT